MKKSFFTGLVFFVLMIGSCTSKTNDDKVILGQPLAGTEKDDDWGRDFKFHIRKILKSDSCISYHVDTLYHDKKIGLQIDIPKKNTAKNGLGEGILLKTLGPISDTFLIELSKAYGIKVSSNQKFVKSIKVSFADLNKFAKTVSNAPIENPREKTYKLFFEDDKESDDGEAELFIVVSEKDNSIAINEKDEDYRPLIVKYLSQK